MKLAFEFSYVVLWVLVVAQGISLYIIARHLGQQIVFSQSAVDQQGLPSGSRLPPAAANVLPTHSNPSALQCFVFLSPRCSACHRLLMVVKAIRSEYEERVEFFGIARPGGTAKMWEQYQTTVSSVTVDEEWIAGSALRIAATPFVVIVTHGKVVATGRPSTATQFRKLADGAIAWQDGTLSKTPMLSS